MAEAIVPTERCSRCHERKPVTDLNKWVVQQKYTQWRCKKCHAECMRASRAKVNADPERRAAQRAYTNRKQKEYRLNNPAWAEKCRDKARRHYRANKETYYANVSARKARKLGSGGSHSAAAWRELRELFGGVCLCCGQPGRLTKDHVLPLSRGGTDDIDNLQPLCLRCNKSKFTRGQDYRTREKVVLAELNSVGRLLFNGEVDPAGRERLAKHKPVSKYTGVTYAPKNANSVKVWRARIQVDNRLVSLGRYPTEEQAAAAYNEAAKRHFGERACLNE